MSLLLKNKDTSQTHLSASLSVLKENFNPRHKIFEVTVMCSTIIMLYCIIINTHENIVVIYCSDIMGGTMVFNTKKIQHK